MRDRLRWGLLGDSKIGREKIIPALRQSRLCAVSAVASRDPERARRAAEAAGIPTHYGSYEALLADPAIDVIYNPLPNHLHAEWTIRALDAGKYVLCEKPIALTAAEAQAIQAAEHRTGRWSAEALMVRFHPQWQRARRLVRQGALGRVQSVQASFSYDNSDPLNIRNHREMGGGALYDIGVYPITLARFLFETEPVRVIGSFDRDPASGIDRLTSGLVDFAGGRHLIFTCATQMARTQSAIVTGDRGKLLFEIPFNPTPDHVSRLIIDDCRDLFGSGAVIEEIPPADHYALQCDALVEAILAGRPPSYGIDDAIKSMHVLDALFRSEGSGQWELLRSSYGY